MGRVCCRRIAWLFIVARSPLAHPKKNTAYHAGVALALGFWCFPPLLWPLAHFLDARYFYGYQQNCIHGSSTCRHAICTFGLLWRNTHLHFLQHKAATIASFLVRALALVGALRASSVCSAGHINETSRPPFIAKPIRFNPPHNQIRLATTSRQIIFANSYSAVVQKKNDPPLSRPCSFYKREHVTSKSFFNHD